MQQDPWQDWANVVFGGWLIVAPLVGLGATADIAAWKSYLPDAAIVLIAGIALARPRRWKEWLNLAIGLWLIAASWALGSTTQAGVALNQVVIGILVGGLALWAMLECSPGGTYTEHSDVI